MLSVADQFDICHKFGMDIINEIFSGEKLTEKQNLVHSWYEKTKYIPRRIEFQKRIADSLYKHKKYYLD